MESESVDLIYLDPPFNSNHNYAAPIGSKAAGAAFKDTWTLKDIDMAWWGEIAETNEGLYTMLDAAGKVGGASVKSYLIYMAVRTIEMHRILSQTGSLYMHCDPTMSHYLKATLDAIFGSKNFLNEIIWRRSDAHNDGKRYGRIHDVLLYYAKSAKSHTWNRIYTPYSPEYLKDQYGHSDYKGRYKPSDLTAASLAGGGYSYTYKGISRIWKISKEEMARRDKAGLLYWPKKKGGVPRYKKYLKKGDGIPLQDLITDISRPGRKESLGYPTQKPLALLERLIESSSDKGDWVFDPFCGCATACSAAEKLDRRWVGIDLSKKAYDLVSCRLKEEAGMDKFTKGAGEIAHRTDIPIRHGSRSSDIKHRLFGEQMGMCNGCGYYYQFKDLEVDHIVPRSRGGQDADENLQLLCGNCNRVKGGKLTMPELKVRLQEKGLVLPHWSK